jgi:hypothetical protein
MALDSTLAIDEHHPIPRVDAYDTLLKTERGAYLGLVIASPLRDDAHSRQRLQRKLEIYLEYFQSPEYRERCGPPKPDRSRIYVSIHSTSDPAMLDLVNHFLDQMLVNGITPVLELIHGN